MFSNTNTNSSIADLERLVVKRTAELVKSRHSLDALLEHIPNMIFVKDAKDQAEVAASAQKVKKAWDRNSS